MSKIYWLNKDKNDIKDIIEVHRRMEDSYCRMGSSHKSRLYKAYLQGFEYHFYFDTYSKMYMASNNICEENNTNIHKSAEWFLKFIDNDFIEPLELKFIDNSSESSTDTFLDQQLKTINN